MHSNKQRAEAGMVSILVTMIMMIVISLIILAITQATRNNQRQQLDQQLSTQAYYAAESGLNQAVRFFATNPSVALNTNGDCTQFITGTGAAGLGKTLGIDNVLDTTTKVSYTCLMVNSTPGSLQKAPLTQDSNTVWRVSDSTGADFTKLNFKWKPDGNTRFSASNTCSATTFTAYANWNCAFGILRVDLVSTKGTVTAASLQTPAKTLYLVPTYTVSGASSAAMTGNTGQIVNVLCTSGNQCEINLTPWTASNEYYVRMTMLYQDAASVTLTANDASGGAKFSGGQAVIDVTGKAGDQLRRVQARIPLVVSDAPIPNYALQTTETLCKQLGVAPGVNSSDACL